MVEFPGLLKEWRSRRRLSQLGLAMEADVSARHISFLETGRSRPSAQMIVHLSDVLSIPVDARNQMMKAAGFAPRYASTPLDDHAMGAIQQAITHMLDRHAPYPGLVLDRHWNAIKINGPAAALLAPFGLHEEVSFLSLLLDPTFHAAIENWPEVAYHTMLRLRAESLAAGGIAELDAAVSALSQSAHVSEPSAGLPTIPTVYRLGDNRLCLFGTMTQFSTVNDETLADLKVELFFPADEASTQLLHALHAQAPIAVEAKEPQP